ncbi:MAG: hypothetical protein ABI053_07395, partial [Lacisediminihabitans sp.]
MGSSLGFRTDLMLLTLQGSIIEKRDGYLCVRTPSDPAFRWGNFILLDTAPLLGSLKKWIDAFRHEFPYANYLAIGIDNTNGDAFAADELQVERVDSESCRVMTATTVAPPSRQDSGTIIRVLDRDNDNDWDAAIALQVANNTEEDPVGYEAFLVRRMASMRALQREGH